VKVFWADQGLRVAARSALYPTATQLAGVARSAVRGSRSIAESIRVVVRGTAAFVFSRDPKAPWWQHGIGAHEIEPKKAEALRFKDGGFSRAAVRHPGMAPRPFLDKVPPLFPAMYRAALRARMRGLR
jgi:hypothetical protein